MQDRWDRYLPTQLAVVETISKVYGNPLAAPNKICYEWARDLGLRRGGETVLYTGCLYQLMAYAGALVNLYQRIGGFGLRAAGALSGISSRLFSWIVSRLVKPDPRVAEYSSRALRSIVKILRIYSVDFGYLYENDIYSGVYLYELGLEEAFTRHAASVYRKLKGEGVKRVITIDPHTTYVLKEIYPRYIESFDIEVKHYLEIVRSRRGEASQDLSKRDVEGQLPVIHDSCYMVRKLGLYEAVRSAAKNIRYIEPRNSGARTLCCGGPIEGISPELSLKIAVRRARELSSTGSERVIVMCPICYTNLDRAFRALELSSITIRDLAEEIMANSQHDESL